MLKRIFSLLSIFVLVLSTIAIFDAPSAQAAQPQAGQYFDHVVTILMENMGLNSSHNFCSSSTWCYIIGNNNASFLNGFYPSHSLSTDYSAIFYGHSSPNYETLLGGEGSYYTTDGLPYWLNPGSNLVDRFASAGLRWNAFAEDASGNATCNFSPGALASVPRGADHFPFLMFSSNNSTSRCSNFLTTSSSTNDFEFRTALNSSSPANFYWLTPNDCDNMHGDSACTNGCAGAGSTCTSKGDGYLSNLVPKILSSKLFTNTNTRSALFITFDESSPSYPNELVYTLMAGPQAKTSYSSSKVYTHYSWLGTIEKNWGLSCLVNDCSASPMSEFFIQSFTMSTSPSTVSIFCNIYGCDPGHAVNSSLTIISLNQFSGLVSLSYIAPPNSVPGVYATGQSSVNIPLGGSVNLNVTAHGSGTTSGYFVWTINASGQQFSFNTTLTIHYTWCAHCVLPGP